MLFCSGKAADNNCEIKNEDIVVQKHKVAIPNDNVGMEIYPLKEWIRNNPDEVPHGYDAQNTSHQLRGQLIKQGWLVKESADEFLLYPASAAAQFEELENASIGPEEPFSDTGEDDVEISFALEHQLRDFIAANLNGISVGGKKLRLYKGSDGRNGIEYRTGVGPIDILAEDEQGDLVVFELKRAKSPDSAIGQIARYMGWLKANFAHKTIHGVIVAKTIDEKLQYAILTMPNVSLFEYTIRFDLRSVEAL